MTTRVLVTAIVVFGVLFAGVRPAAAQKADPKVSPIVEGALKYLAARQKPDGSWPTGVQGNNRFSVAMTGYALLAMFANGNSPKDGPYAKNVDAGVKYLISTQDANGFCGAGGGTMYDHGLATVALAEAYHRTRDDAIKTPLQKAVALIVKAQGEAGGWRYTPQPADGDVSITGFEIPALIDARKAGIDVPQGAIDRAIAFVGSCFDPASGGFSYMPRQGVGGYARTAAAVHALCLCGKRNDPMTTAGVKFLREHPGEEAWFAYSAYYRSGADAMAPDDDANRAYAAIVAKLVADVQRDGEKCWWAGQNATTGPIYATAVYTIVLSVPNGQLELYGR